MERKFKKEEGLVGNSKSNGQNSNPLPTPHTPFAIRTLPGFIPNAEVCDATKVGLCAADDYIVKKEKSKIKHYSARSYSLAHLSKEKARKFSFTGLPHELKRQMLQGDLILMGQLTAARPLAL